jgi:2,4-dienoyl-CoA reductase-like NADH-dependent reductase (Old Yellow Enzyme family)
MSGFRLESPISVGGCSLRNRLYRAPLLECAGNGPEAVDTLISDLEPAASSGAGLIHQGATIVRESGGCAAPEMTRVADPAFVSELERLTDAIHAHGSAIAIQLEYGGLRSMEVWHAAYRKSNPDLEQLAVSRPPGVLRALDRIGALELNPRVMDTEAVRELAADFGRAAARAVEADYDMIHLAGANMGIIQQFLSPFYNRRDDEFGVDPEIGSGVRFLEAVHDEIRDRAGDVPLITKVPSESAAPALLRPRLSDGDAVRTATHLESIGYDGIVPVRCSVFWDMSIVRGGFPAHAWREPDLRDGYIEAFGSRTRAAAVAIGNWLQSRRYSREPGWNAPLARSVRNRVDIPVFLEGGLRSREQLDRYLGDAADLVGMGRPFYAEPRLPARLLDGPSDTHAVCADCNNCAVAQAAGVSGTCRTPSVLRRAGRLRKQGAYDGENPNNSGRDGKSH